MTPLQGFLLGLGVTVVFLVAVIATGVTARRKQHIPSVVLFLSALGFTIYHAERMGTTLDLKSAGWITPVHLTMAKATVCLYVLPIVSGVMTLRDARWRPRHRVVAWLLIVMTLATVVTGTWMALASEPLAAS